MNLEKLFEMQRKLDERIVREKGLVGQDLLDKKILALQVELGELANEWRGFKYWSEDQKPRKELWKDCNFCGGRGFVSPANYPYGHQKITCIECRGESQFKTNPLLEEYVDCLHFLLSIGLESEIGAFTGNELMKIKMSTIEMQFITLFKVTVTFLEDISYYQEMWELFLGLGEMLGFTWDEIEQAYLQKNAENHRRQAEGY